MSRSKSTLYFYLYFILSNSTSRKKKSKSKSRSKLDSEHSLERERVKELLFEEEESAKTLPSSGRNSPAVSGSSDRKTEAERRFEEVQKRRVSFTLNSEWDAYSSDLDPPACGTGGETCKQDSQGSCQ